MPWTPKKGGSGRQSVPRGVRRGGGSGANGQGPRWGSPAVGLSAFRDVLDPEPIPLSMLAGQRVAVDANNLLWSFVTGMARGGAPTGPHGRPVSHLIGLANRATLFSDLGVEPVWVFDGKPPELKAETLAEREAKIEAAREAGKTVQGTRLEPEQIEEAQTLLDALGQPYVQAPGEGDAQLAAWTREGHVDAAVTQDYDAALFGSPTTLRYVKRTGSRDPERIDLGEALDRAGITREQLVDAAILVGTDFNEGIHGVGPVTALKLVREHGNVFDAASARGAELPRAEPVRELFLDPPLVDGPPPTRAAPDRARVRAICETHGLGQDRADRLVDALAIAR